MGRKRVLIAAIEGNRQQSESLRAALLDSWRAVSGSVEIDWLDFGLPPSAGELRAALRDAGALIIPFRQNHQTPDVLAVLEIAGQLSVPVLVLRDDGRPCGTATFAGALSMPASTPTATLVATLEGMIHSGAESRRLRAELSLANRCSGGLEDEIVRMHEELQLAAMVQRELLPRELPIVNSVSFGTLWRPANYVSGDIYDVARLDEDHVGVFLADAVGHGVPAALMTMVISRSLLMKDIEGTQYRLLPPSEVLSRLNAQMLERQARTTRFATAVYALIDCRNRIMTLAGAGHPPPLLVRGDGQLQPLETEGGLLGIFENEPYEQIEIELEIDDRVLFYSDGFEQAFPSSAKTSHERRVPTMRYRNEFDAIARAGLPQECIERLRSRLDSQAGSLHQADDVTLICAHAGPLDSPAVAATGHAARPAATHAG